MIPAPTDHAALRDEIAQTICAIVNDCCPPSPYKAADVVFAKHVSPLLAAQQAVEVERDELKAALKPFAELLSDREQHAHEALQVGGYVPLDHGFEVEVPLVLLYTARAVFLGASTHKGQPHE